MLLGLRGRRAVEASEELNAMGKMHTKVPTVRPATTDGIDPVLIYPNVPPPAVKAPIM